MNCPYCKRYFNVKSKTIEHIEKAHSNELASSKMDSCQALYYGTHGTLEGVCMCGCGQKTAWNYATGKPSKVTSDPECRARLRTLALNNHKRVYGVETLTNDMEHQKKMLANRHTSGNYRFTDGGEVQYASQEELAFLKFCDTVMDFKSSMIQDVPRVFPYYDKKAGKQRMYIPDYYLPDYNLIVEIKDGGKHTNTNPKFIEETKYKVAYKDEAMKAQNEFNFIKVVDRNYGSFVEALYTIVHDEDKTASAKNKKLVIITESASIDYDELFDANVPEEFNDIYLIVWVDKDTNLVNSVAVSESYHLLRMYATDYMTNRLVAVTRDDPMFSGCIGKVYRIASSDKDLITSCLQKIVSLANSDTGNNTWDIMSIFKSFGICFISGDIRNTEKARTDFIYLSKMNDLWEVIPDA